MKLVILRDYICWPFQSFAVSYWTLWNLLICQAFDAYVVGKENAPGIVVLQEWWGVDFEIKNHAVKISELAPGFKALIPE